MAELRRHHPQQRKQKQREDYGESECARRLDRGMMRVIQVTAAVRLVAAHHHAIMRSMVVMMGMILAFQDHAVGEAGTWIAKHDKADEQYAAGRPERTLCPVL